MRIYFISIIIVISAFITGCNSESAAKQDMDYDQTKKMVIDILQTDEGKKALQDILQDDKMKQHLVLESDVVKDAITEALVSKKGAEMWQKLFEDPTFVETFVSSTAKEQKKLFKSLMSDAEFQKKLMEILQNPEMANQNLKLLKSQQFKEHLETTIEETLDTPLFRAKMEKALLKAADQKGKQEKEGEQNQNNQEESPKEES